MNFAQPLGTDLTLPTAADPALPHTLPGPFGRANPTAAETSAPVSPPESVWARVALHTAVLFTLALVYSFAHTRTSFPSGHISRAQNIRRVLLFLHAHALADIFYFFTTGAPVPDLIGVTIGSIPVSIWGLVVLIATLSFTLNCYVLVGPGERHKNRAFLTRCALFGFFDWAATVLLPLGGALLLGVLVFGRDSTGFFVTCALSALLIVYLSQQTFYRTVREGLGLWRMTRSSASLGSSTPWALCLAPLLAAPMGVSAMGGDGTGSGVGSALGWTSLLLPLLGLMMAGGGPHRGAVLGPNVKPKVREAIENMRAGATDLGYSLANEGLGANDARVLAEELKVNASLTELYLYGNEIGNAGAQAIAEALKVNASLTKFDLSINQIGPAGAQAIAEALKVNASLTVLSLYGNEIGDAGAQAIAEALKVNAALTVLNLWSNQIGDAGSQAILSADSSLVYLNLSSNQIRVIPTSFLKKSRLTSFWCDRNPWISPPPEVVKKGLDAIRHHLFLMEREGTVRCKTGRLMVVGVAEAGKTSLFKALESLDNKTDPIAKDNRTIGIDLARWVPDHDTIKLATKGSELDLTGLEINVCDFAGQREYAVVHQLFLTSRAVYLLVFDASKPLDLATDADPWLDSIQVKSPGARVILIATHADECSRESLDERCSGFANHIVRRLVSMHSSTKRSGSSTTDDLESSPRVHGIDLSSPPADGDFGGSVLRVSSTIGHGIRDARLAIIGELAKLDAIEMWIPTSYDTLLRFIIEKRLTTSSLVHHLNDLHKEMSLHPLYCDPALPLDEFKAALSFWHDVGEVYVFHDQVFVDRSLFLFKLVKSIAMSAAEVEKKLKNPLLGAQSKEDLRRLKDSGELTRSVLFGCLWANKDEFPEADRNDFVWLLEKFDVIYPVSEDLWLVPALVPDKPVPDDLLDRFDHLPNHYVRRVTIPFRPFALLQRLHTDIPRGFDIQMGVSWGLVVKRGNLGEAALYHLHTAAEVFTKDQLDSGKVGPHHLDEDDAVSVITIRASSLDMLRAVLDGVLRLLGRFEFGAQVWVPLKVTGSSRDGCGVTHLRVCGFRGREQGESTLKQTHGPDYSTWRAEKLPSGLMDPALGFADLEPRCGPSAVALSASPSAASPPPGFSTSTPLTSSPNLYTIVRHQLFVTPSSRREALQVLELLRPLFGPLVQAVANLHLPNGGHLLGDPVSGQIKVDPRDITWDRVDGVVKFDLSSLPVLTQDSAKSKDVVHVQRLLAFVLLKCEWDDAFVSKPLADLAMDLEAEHWLEAADLVRTSSTSLNELCRHPFFWSLPQTSGLMATFGEEMGKLPRPPTPSMDRADMETLASGLAGVPDLDWSCLPPVHLRHLGYVPPEGERLREILAPFAAPVPGQKSPAYHYFKENAYNCYLRHSGVRCPMDEHIEAFDAVYKPDPPIPHRCLEDSCVRKCDGFRNCRPEPWRFTALAEQVRHALVHCPHWMNFAASDVAAVGQLLGLPAGKAIADDAVVRWLVWPDASAPLPPYLARGGYLMLIVRILRAIKGKPLGESFKVSLAKLEG